MLKKSYNKLGALMLAGVMLGNASQAYAADDAGTDGNNFSTIAENITGSISSLPGLLSALSYMFGLLLGVLGVMKIKDHVENPTQTPLKDGAIRLAAGGALFALPILFEAMSATIGEGETVDIAQLNKIELGLSD